MANSVHRQRCKDFHCLFFRQWHFLRLNSWYVFSDILWMTWVYEICKLLHSVFIYILHSVLTFWNWGCITEPPTGDLYLSCMCVKIYVTVCNMYYVHSKNGVLFIVQVQICFSNEKKPSILSLTLCICVCMYVLYVPLVGGIRVIDCIILLKIHFCSGVRIRLTVCVHYSRTAGAGRRLPINCQWNWALTHVNARVGHCGKASEASWNFSTLCKWGPLNAAVGQSDWFLVSCNIATVGHGKHFLGISVSRWRKNLSRVSAYPVWRRVAEANGFPGVFFVLLNSVSSHYVIFFCASCID